MNSPCIVHRRKNSPVIRGIQPRQNSLDRIDKTLMFIMLSVILLFFEMNLFHQAMRP
ncbi:hypothetical protein D3C73_1483130 [compost metagenome]